MHEGRERWGVRGGSRGVTYRFDGSHSKVIVVLLRQLFTAQLVHLCHLTGQVLTGLKAF